MTKASGKLLVQYQLVNGSHFFVGVDGCAETTGLCVGSRDLKKAFDQVGPALTYLLRRNHDITAVCTPKWTFAEFREWLLGQIKKDLVADSSDRGVDSSCVAPATGKSKQWTIPTLESLERRSVFSG